MVKLAHNVLVVIIKEKNILFTKQNNDRLLRERTPGKRKEEVPSRLFGLKFIIFIFRQFL